MSKPMKKRLMKSYALQYLGKYFIITIQGQIRKLSNKSNAFYNFPFGEYCL